MLILPVWLTAAIALSATGIAVQHRDADGWWFDVLRKLDRGAVTLSDQSLKEARDTCLTALAARIPQPRPALVRYAIAYADWRLALFPNAPKKQASVTLDEAVSLLREVLKGEPNNAEAHALLGSVYGSQITSPWRGISLGPKSANELKRGVEIEPDYPRVVLLQGVGKFHTPRMFGGGVEKAEKLFRRAIELFEAEAPDRPWPNWGRPDASAWLGVTLSKKGDREGAQKAYEKALSMEPEYAWVRDVLVPALEHPRRSR